MIVVSGVMTFNPSIHDRVVERARTLTAETLKEPGCRTYGFWTDPDVPGRFRVFEEWDSQEALTGHFAAPHFAAFGQDFNEGDLISVDMHRYIDPEIAGLYCGAAPSAVPNPHTPADEVPALRGTWKPGIRWRDSLVPVPDPDPERAISRDSDQRLPPGSRPTRYRGVTEAGQHCIDGPRPEIRHQQGGANRLLGSRPAASADEQSRRRREPLRVARRRALSPRRRRQPPTGQH